MRIAAPSPSVTFFAVTVPVELVMKRRPPLHTETLPSVRFFVVLMSRHDLTLSPYPDVGNALCGSSTPPVKSSLTPDATSKPEYV